MDCHVQEGASAIEQQRCCTVCVASGLTAVWPALRKPAGYRFCSHAIDMLCCILLQGVDSRQLWDKLCPTVGIGDTPRLTFNRDSASSSIPNLGATASLSAISCTALFSHLLNGFAGKQLRRTADAGCQLLQQQSPAAANKGQMVAALAERQTSMSSSTS
jgi:hypothetical protein